MVVLRLGVVALALGALVLVGWAAHGAYGLIRDDGPSGMTVESGGTVIVRAPGSISRSEPTTLRGSIVPLVGFGLIFLVALPLITLSQVRRQRSYRSNARPGDILSLSSLPPSRPPPPGGASSASARTAASSP